MATLKDIAVACGVSTATVSYVVNNGPRSVLPATRERVLKAISEFGYHPNAHARGLRGIRMDTIGIAFPHNQQPFENDYFAPVLSGIMDVATDRQMATLLVTGLSWEEAEQSAPRLCDGRCDGFVLLAPLKRCNLAQQLLARHMPVVVVGTHPENVSVDTVDSDNAMGARIAVEHLISLGHRRIAVAMGDPHSSSTWERLAGYRAALAGHDLACDESLIVPETDTRESQIQRFFELLKDPARRPTAIFCFQDAKAPGVAEAARDLGLHIPRDLSLVGFDDITAAAGYSPALTTIRQPMRLIGRRAAELLCRNMEKASVEPTDYLFPVELVERSSTAPPLGVPERDLVSFATSAPESGAHQWR